MTEEQFDIQMDRVRSNFGKQHYNDFRVKLIWERVKFLPYDNFCKIVDHFMDTCRKAPLPAEFSEAARSERRGIPNDKPIEVSFIRCEHCGDLGIVRLENAEESIDQLAYCDCGASAGQHWKLVKVNDKIKGAFKLSRCPLVWFLPKREGKFDAKRILRLGDAWLLKVRAAEQFWYYWEAIFT